jgi:subtilase family serine protease
MAVFLSVATLALVSGPLAAASTPPSNVRDACGQATPGHARCFAQVRTDLHEGRGPRTTSSLPSGYGPADLRTAYHLPTGGGTNQTVAVIDAGDDATAEADLAVYRQTYGLPACTAANGCFRKIGQRGDTSSLPPDAGWGVEIALDLDMVSAACPNCEILLAEADSSGLDSLAATVNAAAAAGATEISNSYGSAEVNDLQDYAAAYVHPGVAITVSSGDSGYGEPASFPATLTSVLSVGGTSLSKADNARGWAERAWNSNGGAAGSGCSAWIPKPAWQRDANCPGRMVADVSADADPQTGPAVYGTTDGMTGWSVIGGTSASAPYIAGVIALAGNPSRYPDASYLYAHADELYDAADGDNVLKQDCGDDYQCTAMPGYDGPTGLGAPNGLAAF